MKPSMIRIPGIAFLLFHLISCGGDSEDPSMSDEKNILSFSINGTEGTIDQSLTTVSLELLETDLSNLTPTISVSANAEISPASGVAQDFTSPVTYTVTAGNGSMVTYTVTVSSLIDAVTLAGQGYEIVFANMSWANAADFAVSRGGFLAEINDQTEQEAIFDALMSASIDNSNTVAPDGGDGSYVWIGGNDLGREGTWIWDGNNDNDGIQFWMGDANGTAVDGLYNNWGNEPDDFQGQDGLGLALTNWPLGIAGEWNDVDHTNELYFVIEIAE